MNDASLSPTQRAQIALIHTLMQQAAAQDMPLWLESGWAVDARQGRVTREHGDIDLAVPAPRISDFKNTLRKLGAGAFEETDYGFLVHVQNILLDCEPCHPIDGAYELEDVPPGACPLDAQGTLQGEPVRCVSWHAILWEYFYYLQELPYEAWPRKDKDSYAFIRQTMGEETAQQWHAQFLARQQAESQTGT
jgi:2''-aminoglycoside nucleotidyltransferase